MCHRYKYEYILYIIVVFYEQWPYLVVGREFRLAGRPRTLQGPPSDKRVDVPGSKYPRHPAAARQSCVVLLGDYYFIILEAIF